MSGEQPTPGPAEPGDVTGSDITAADTPSPDPAAASPAAASPGAAAADTASPDTIAAGGPETARGGRRRPRRAIIIAVAVCAALVAAVIAIDSSSHPAKPAAKPLAPDFTLPSLSDPAQQVSLNAYRGQPVIVNFFASWCPPCKLETPLLASFYRTSRAGVVVIGVDADDNAPAARQFLAAERITYPVAFETTPALANAYGVSAIGIPETFFLDPRHRIVKRVLGDVTAKELTDDTAMIKSSVTKD